MVEVLNEIQSQTLLTDQDWQALLHSIKQRRCTPFLGPEMVFGDQPVRDHIAREWGNQYKYPINNCFHLAHVAQFIVTQYNAVLTKSEITELLRAWRNGLPGRTANGGMIDPLRGITPPDLSRRDSPHRILANLPLPIYVMTTYDDFMFEALKKQDVAPFRDPKRELCRWNEAINVEPSVFESDFQPTVANPVVFHLYGHDDSLESLVLTEDDILDFLVAVARDGQLIPRRIQEAFTNTSLLFLGYRLADLDFKVLLRSLASYLERNVYTRSKSHISVQLVAVCETITTNKEKLIAEYLSKYCDKLDMQVCWATCQEFLSELQERWNMFNAAGGANGHV
jgi:SIR2-like domain